MRNEGYVTEGMRTLFRLVFLCMVCLGVGAVSRFMVTTETRLWYKSLPLAPFSPKAWVFPIVWTFLYLTMAFSAFLTWEKASPRPFALQLLANMLWSFFFFYLQNPLLSFIDLMVMVVLVLWTMKTFYPVSKKATGLLVPYFLWILFAFYLNGYIVYHM